MRSITLDSNIYVSALEFGGKPMALLQSALDGEVDVAISQPILDETLRVLRDKFSWSRDDLRGAEATIRAATHVVTPTMKLNVVESDPDDNKIVECAVESGSEAIVTHDKDLCIANIRPQQSWGKRVMGIRLNCTAHSAFVRQEWPWSRPRFWSARIQLLIPQSADASPQSLAPETLET